MPLGAPQCLACCRTPDTKEANGQPVRQGRASSVGLRLKEFARHLVRTRQWCDAGLCHQSLFSLHLKQKGPGFAKLTSTTLGANQSEQAFVQGNGEWRLTVKDLELIGFGTLSV